MSIRRDVDLLENWLMAITSVLKAMRYATVISMVRGRINLRSVRTVDLDSLRNEVIANLFT